MIQCLYTEISTADVVLTTLCKDHYMCLTTSKSTEPVQQARNSSER